MVLDVLAELVEMVLGEVVEVGGMHGGLLSFVGLQLERTTSSELEVNPAGEEISLGSAARFVPLVAVGEQAISLARAPRTAEIRVHGPRIVDRRLHDPPSLLDHVLTGEATGRTLDRIAE